MAVFLNLLVDACFASGKGAAVLVEIFEEDLGKAGTWPDAPSGGERYEEIAFGFFDLPQKYISTGVRADRAHPTLVRATAKIKIPAGRHRVLLRARGESRLLINGKAVLSTPFWQPGTYGRANAGEQPQLTVESYLDLGPNFRYAPPGNREDYDAFEFDGDFVSFVMETRIGDYDPDGSPKLPFRTDLGETVVAISYEGTNRWQLLSPDPENQISYTDFGWKRYREDRRAYLDEMDTRERARLRGERAWYWKLRREEARHYLSNTNPEPVPALPGDMPAYNAIDHFLGERLVEARKHRQPASNGGPDYFREVKPILEQNCYSCHQGSKVKGGLRLDIRELAFKGGKYDGAAVEPGDIDGSSIIYRVRSDDSEDIMPQKGDPLSEEEIALLEQWIETGAHWPDFETEHFEPTDVADDLTFLRRSFLDTVGLAPSEEEIEAYLQDPPEARRELLIDRLLADSRWADHWMGYWLEVLAENPNLINPTLNNTGPFRWWLYESLKDNKPLDLFVTELIRMEGSVLDGGPAGFGMATENDVPMAAKGITVSSAFLGVNMSCARCHDSPSNEWKQEELFSLGALMKRESITLPKSSSVILDHLREGGRKPLIEVTLEPGSVVEPAWPFPQFCDEETGRRLAADPSNSRDYLAALLTAPQNERFSEVMVNRIWQRYFGRGIVPTIADWDVSVASHPKLLRWLSRELVRSGYDAKAIARLILSSHAYQRESLPSLLEPEPLFVAPAQRSIGPEQLVDSLYASTGKAFSVEPVCMDLDGSRAIDNALDLGHATRAWMLASVSNERDRPSLTLPRTQAVSEVLHAFGWRAARPDAGTGIRMSDPTVMQPALISNGLMTSWLSRLSDDNGITDLVLEEQPLETLVERLYLRFFTRYPTEKEQERIVAYLKPGYGERILSRESQKGESSDGPVLYAAWSNHMLPEANEIRLREEIEAREGEPPTDRLDADWRERMEDVVWALLNSPEWIRIP